MNGENLWKIFQPQCPDGGSTSDDRPPRLPRAGMSRRTFIEMIGYSAAALAFSSCRAPDQKIVPYLNQPVELTPGIANWYASTCGGCSAACGVLVKVRDGRPIKLEGNPEHPLTRGGLCAVAHAMVFGLFDAERLRQPLIDFGETTWDEVDRQIIQKLDEIKKSGGKLRLITPAITSPTSHEIITTFISQFADARHIVYEPVSHSAISEAHLRTHRTAAIPLYQFDKAKLVVSFGADFLGTWVAPTQFTRDYANARDLRDGRHQMLRHVQFESRMSLTGSNADKRIKISPAEDIGALLLLAKLIAAKTGPAGFGSFDEPRLSPSVREAIEKTAEELVKLRGESLVLSGSNDIAAQCAVNFINHALGNYGQTLDLSRPFEPTRGGDQQMVELVGEMNAGEVAAVIISGVNPAYDYYDAEGLTLGLSKVPLKISLNPTKDETTQYAEYVCPQHHFLEAWDDAEPVRGIFSLAQPTIAPLFHTRAYQESLLRWSGDGRSYYDVLRASWQQKLFPQQTKYATFDEFWDRSLHDGVLVLEAKSSAAPSFVASELSSAVKRLNERSARAAEGLSLILYEKVAQRNGAHANNPWLQELPDPITKVTWDNYACVSAKLAEKMQLEEGQIVRITKDSHSIQIPVFIQPGQDDNTVAVALGYGRWRAGKAGSKVGVNAYPLVSFDNGAFQYEAHGIRLERTSEKIEFAPTQRHNTRDGRPIIQELTLAEYLNGGDRQGTEHKPHSIWKDHEYGEHKWAMVVDLSACVGCSACLLSCQAENNVPVVGKEEVLRQREMHWIRLDRYYEGEEDDLHAAYQPVMCFQCDNASCESVCPVLATVHSSEGLNMQVYNRCVGTRYCANNCAYKVRRFNWFDYRHSDPMANLALNPDVTVRTRGVMEKCTFCVQRIEEVKIGARNEGRPIRDGEIQTACQQSCPAQAITFGDLVDGQSRVNRLKHDKRDYILLEELNLRPQISYLAIVRNSEEA
jgi:molybdopterin-containing oxidoreductase family iron-sulfur binding subunit